MKNVQPTIGLVSGKLVTAALGFSEELVQPGTPAWVITREKTALNCEQIRQLTGQSGQDLFFNGWKLLF